VKIPRAVEEIVIGGRGFIAFQGTGHESQGAVIAIDPTALAQRGAIRLVAVHRAILHVHDDRSRNRRRSARTTPTAPKAGYDRPPHSWASSRVSDHAGPKGEVILRLPEPPDLLAAIRMSHSERPHSERLLGRGINQSIDVSEQVADLVDGLAKVISHVGRIEVVITKLHRKRGEAL